MAKKEAAPVSKESGRKGTKVVSCSCTHEYQDVRYGKGKRLANLKTKTGEYSCTVCSKLHK